MVSSERLKRAWQRLNTVAGREVGRWPVPPQPRGAGQTLPGVPEAVLDEWPEWHSTWQRAWDRLPDRPGRQQRFLRALLGTAVVPFLDEVERATDTQWVQLQTAVERWWGAATARTRADLDVETRVKVWLTSQDRRHDLAEFCASRWFEHGWIATRVGQGRVIAEFGDLDLSIPDDVRELSPDQSPLNARLRTIRTHAEGWQLEVFVSIDHVSLAPDPAIRVWAEHGSRRTELTVVPRPDPRANHGDMGGQRYADAAPGAVLVSVPAALVRSGHPVPLLVEISTAGLTRTGPLTQVDRRGGARQGVRGTVPHLEIDDRGRLLLAPATPGARADLLAELETFQLTPTGLRVQGRWHGTAPATTEFRLVSDHGQHAGAPCRVTGTAAAFEVVLPLTETRWGREHQPLPEGRYWLRARSGADEIPVRLDAAAHERTLDWQTPRGEATETHQVRWVSQGADRVAGLMLRPALAEDERGPFHQWRLQTEALEAPEPIDERLVYLQCFTGTSATDSQRALRDEIRRTRPDLRVVWGVAEPAAWTPPGDERVLVSSAAWYRTVSSAKYLSQNGDVDRWFRARPEQRFLATFHGYPSKSMGIGMWAGKGYTPLRIEQELARTRDVWSLILTPDPAMDHYYRAQYDYDGPIVAQGLPRDDALRSPQAPLVRESARELLGIAEHETAVLYAPTWRDDKATDWRAAEAVVHLDIEQASRALGSDHVFLIRGHRFTQPSAVSDRARTLDVTDHPEINDLILASDVAVLDYSSLRFDFSLTGRPMVFLVPDLADYTGSVRGFLYDFPSSAPGPCVETVEQVVAALADLPALTAAHAQEYAAFEQRFNRFMDGRAAGRVVRAWLDPD